MFDQAVNFNRNPLFKTFLDISVQYNNTGQVWLI